MWPRTAEERARNRNTGFVCFMTRAGAQDAMDAYQDADPLGTGRRLVLRWGKNVKKTVKFGTGGVPTNLRKKSRDEPEMNEGNNAKFMDRNDSIGAVSTTSIERKNDVSTESIKLEGQYVESTATKSYPSEQNGATQKSNSSSKIQPVLGPIYDPLQHSAEAIIVTMPTDPRRLKVITTVASFVAKDGSIFEHKLIEAQSSNPEFRFLLPRDDSASRLPGNSNPYSSDDDVQRLAEHIFYRWRVYSFAQGDGINSWRTNPFVMIEPHGRFWIPPPLNEAAAQQEEEAEKRREEVILAAQEERRNLSEKKEFMTGRQLEHAKFSIGLTQEKGGGIKLNDWEKETFHELLRKKLCASQESICEAMAFAFDKSGAAKEISELLKEALLESNNGISVDTRIARLFLVSDILFNSQQPGVRNAFQYRSAIEAMSPEVFESLGRHGNGKAGRMTMNKLRRAVSSVLSAWTNWSVYNTTFLDELQSRFEGREISSAKLDESTDTEKQNVEEANEQNLGETSKKDDRVVISTVPRGEWKAAEQSAADDNDDQVDGEAIEDVDGKAIEDVDGEELEDVDGEALDDVDGEALDDDIDGDVLDDAEQR